MEHIRRINTLGNAGKGRVKLKHAIANVNCINRKDYPKGGSLRLAAINQCEGSQHLPGRRYEIFWFVTLQGGLMLCPDHAG